MAYINFTIPDYQQEYGQDWQDFLDIIDENVDHTTDKAMELYWLLDPDRAPDKVIDILCDLYKIVLHENDDITIKRIKLRAYVSKYKNKGLDIIYLDLAESITGIRGELHRVEENGNFVWDTSSWYSAPATDEDIVFFSVEDKWKIYFDVKTTDSGELDIIQHLMQDNTMRCAFYKMYLIDSSWNILRTI